VVYGRKLDRDILKYLCLDACRHVYKFIRHMRLDPNSSPSVSTPLHPHITYSKADCPEEVDTALRARLQPSVRSWPLPTCWGYAPTTSILQRLSSTASFLLRNGSTAVQILMC